ncbi:MAG: flippase-like domain-containing protein [Chloroflexi bacterium]|nr:flippase-like domain-containing protein [Chloroflexota bacterium]
MLRSRRVWIGFAISVIFLGIFFYQTDVSEIWDSFKEANYAIAFASLPVYFAGIWVRTIRWQYLLRPVVRVSTARLFPVVIIGLMANNLIPARAGELVRAYILGEREKVSKAASLGTIAVDRLFDGLTLVPMLLIVVAFVGSSERFPLPAVDWTVNLVQLAIVMSVLFGGALAVLLVLAFSEAARNRADELITTLTPERLRPSIEGLAHSFFDGLHVLRSPVDMGLAWLMSMVSWLLEATMYYIVGLAFDIDVGFQHYLLATAAANLAIAVLASQGGIGPFELVTKQTFIAAGVATGGAEAYAIGLHALVLLPVIVVGLYFLGTMNLSLGEMFRRATGDASSGASMEAPPAPPGEVPNT